MTATPHPVDLAVGAKVAELRKFRGLSQSDLGRALRLTFQQVQKYEKGTNRISCSKLTMIASTLGVTPAYFFGTDEAEPTPLPVAMPSRLIRSFGRLSGRQITLLSDLAETMASPEHPAMTPPADVAVSWEGGRA